MPNQKRARQKAARQRKVEAQRRLQRRSQMMKRGVVVAIIAAVVITTVALLASNGSTPPTTTTTTTTTTTIPNQDKAAQTAANNLAVQHGCPASLTARVNKLTWKKAPAMTINKNALYYAHVTTTAGKFVIELEPNLAPVTVNSFIFLAKHQYYNCNTIFRVIPTFMMQTGDPTGSGSGGPGYTLPDEYPKAGNPTYPNFSVAMANGGPNTGGSQFFITDGAEGASLSNAYTLFGKVIAGKKVVDTIVKYGLANGSGLGGEPPDVVERMLTVTISAQP